MGEVKEWAVLIEQESDDQQIIPGNRLTHARDACSILPWVFYWTDEMTKEEFEAHKASQIAALLEWDMKRREVAEFIRKRIVESISERDTLPVTSRNVMRDDQ